MEFKSVILSVLLTSLLIAQIQVEAKSCCPSTTTRNMYNACRVTGGSRTFCASLSGCKIASGNTCPPGYDNVTLQTDGDVANEYCKLGCASVLCGAITTLQNSDPNEVVSGAVKQCTNACASLCAKGSTTAL